MTSTRVEFDQFRAVLDESGRAYELVSIVGTERGEALLTDRQRELLEIAVVKGYFEVPEPVRSRISQRIWTSTSPRRVECSAAAKRG